MRIKLIILLLIQTCAFYGQTFNPYLYSIPKSADGKNGMVVSAHPLASAAGVEVLQKGGNAIDAAIAVQLALAVVFPEAGNIGGGGFLVAALKNGKRLAIDFREKAPEKASRDMYLDEKGNPVEGASWHGALSSGVPGTIAGMFSAHRYARLPFSDLINPAIRLAEFGFVITKQEADNLNSGRQDFLRFNKHANAFTTKLIWKEGDTLIQSDLSHTLKLVRDLGPSGFYEGPTAQKIVTSCAEQGGIITLNDLMEYKAIERTPVEFNYRGYKVCTMPLPSSGGVLLPQMLGMAEQFPLGEYGFLSAKTIQLMVEIERRAFADRAKFLGDPDFVKVPVKQLTSESYLKNRMSDFSWETAGNSKIIGAGIPDESMETTHFSVIDKEGNAVAVTTTLNGGYGSCHVVDGAGFFMNNEMDDFSIKPGVPNAYGAVGALANAIVPGKRMLSSMTPTILLKDEKPFLIIGSPGGTTIITTVFQSIVDIVDFHLSLSDAINKPKFHHQWLPDNVRIESEFPEDVIQQLKNKGYIIVKSGKIGRTDGILVHPDGSFEGVGDGRGDDAAVGF